MNRTFVYCPKCASALVDDYRGEAWRRVCTRQGCGYVHWNNPTPVVAAIVQHEGDVILAHNRSWPAHWYGLITGFLEPDEQPEAAVLREVEEELALQGRVTEFVGHYCFPAMNQLIIAYHVAAEGQITLNEELDDYKRIPPARLKPWPAATGEAVADWLRKHGFQRIEP